MPKVSKTTAIIAGATSALAVIGATVALTPAASAASATMVLSEVYGGGNSGATLTNDFIELTNLASATTSVDGWSVQYQPAGGTSNWQVTPLAGSVASGAFYLIGEGAGADGTTPLPTTQASGNGSSKGYWIQDPNPDSNPATSEGIFVFTSSSPTVQVGDPVLGLRTGASVRLSGRGAPLAGRWPLAGRYARVPGTGWQAGTYAAAAPDPRRL